MSLSEVLLKRNDAAGTMLLSLVLASSATARRANQESSCAHDAGACIGGCISQTAAEEDVDDAALAASLQVAAKRTSSARDALEKRRRREAQPRRAVDAPQKPTLAMRDSRVSLRWSRSRSFANCSTRGRGARSPRASC